MAPAHAIATNNTVLLDLPNEVIHQIVLSSVVNRGVRRALRLRLVCKLFSTIVRHAVFESGLLDKFPRDLEKWYCRSDSRKNHFWHSYLVYKVQKATDAGRFLDIRDVATAIRDESGGEMADIVDQICWCTLSEVFRTGSGSTLENLLGSPFDLRQNLLCAAAYLGLPSLAEKLLQLGYCPTTRTVIFFSPVRLATWVGNTDMLQTLLRYAAESVGMHTNFLEEEASSKVRREIVKGAGIGGDLAMMRFALDPFSRTTFNADQPHTQFSPRSGLGEAMRTVQWDTRNPEIHKYLEEFFDGEQENRWLASQLLRQCRYGNLDMARYLLEIGANIHGFDIRWGIPLGEACRNCHDDVIDFLLKQGADPSAERTPNGMLIHSVLHSAASAGSLAIVRKLLDNGANTSGRIFNTLRRAVMVEHTDMLNLLLSVTPNPRPLCERLLRQAEAAGLESMAHVLREYTAPIPAEK